MDKQYNKFKQKSSVAITNMHLNLLSVLEKNFFNHDSPFSKRILYAISLLLIEWVGSCYLWVNFPIFTNTEFPISRNYYN